VPPPVQGARPENAGHHDHGPRHHRYGGPDYQDGGLRFPPEALSLERVTLAVKHGLEEFRLRQENETLKKSIERRYEIVGRSTAVQSAQGQIALAGPTNGWVLLSTPRGFWQGAGGAGPFTRASKRTSGPFIEVNCAAIPQELIESELFGHEKAAFTGATGMTRGKFELARPGAHLPSTRSGT